MLKSRKPPENKRNNFPCIDEEKFMVINKGIFKKILWCKLLKNCLLMFMEMLKTFLFRNFTCRGYF